jgi:hypothetical protein
MGGALAAPATLGSFESKTATANNALTSIRARVTDIENLKKQADQEGKKAKSSCIEEKLQRAKTNEGAAGSIMDGWALGASDSAFAQRQVDRLLLLQVYGTVYYEEARACGDGRPGSTGDERPGVPGGPGQLPPPPPGADVPSRPPRFDRPPPLSPY